MKKLGFYSNLPIEDGDKVVAFLATATIDVEYVDGFELVLPILFPLFGEYDQDSKTLRNIETTHCKRIIRKVFKLDNPSYILEKFNDYEWNSITKVEFFRGMDICSEFLNTCEFIILFEHVSVYESILDQADNIFHESQVNERSIFDIKKYLELNTRIDYEIPNYLNKNTIDEGLAKEIMEYEKFDLAFAKIGGEYCRSITAAHNINPRTYWRIKETMSDLMFSKIEE